MVVVKKKTGESEDRLIARFRKETFDKIKEVKDKARFRSKAEERKERKYRLKHLSELQRKRAY